jgi:dephospho-CoA kinase
MKKIILGFAGELACGKGTATKYITEKHNGGAHKFSNMLRDVAHRMHLEESRENIQKISTFFRQNFGEDIMSRVIYKDVVADSHSIIAVDGVRRLMDIKYLTTLPGFKLIYIEANIERRYERIIKRGENSDDLSKTFEGFKEDHLKETESQIKDLKKKADFVLDNNGTLEDLYKQIEDVLNKLSI